MEECPLSEKSSQDEQNSIFSYNSALALVITVFLGYCLYRLCLVLVNIFRRYLTVSVHVIGGSINNLGDKSYSVLLGWLGETITTFPHFTIKLKGGDSCCGSKKETCEISTLPSFGTHCFQYNECWFLLQRAQTPEVSNYDVSYESITLTTLKGNKGVLNQLLMEAKKHDKNDDEEKTAFYYITCGDWSMFGEPRKRRQLDTVIMKDGIKEKLHADIKDFLDSEDWYSQRGIPYRRGYLLHGPPGCGKSSFIRAIAGEFGFAICMLSLSVKDLTDDALNELMNSAPDKSLILLEDIDAAFKSRDSAEASSKEANLAFEGAGASKVTFRGLLNALDGVASTEGRIIFLTTNYIDRLDPALVRPGRVDFKVLVDLPDEDQLKQMFGRFYPEAEVEQKTQFAKIIKAVKTNVSMAMIQGLFMMNKFDAQGSIDNAEKYFNEQYFPTKKEEDISELSENKIENETTTRDKDSGTSEKETKKESTVGEKETEKETTAEKKETEKASIVGEKETEKASTVGEKDTEKASTEGEKETEKASTVGKKETEKASTEGEKETEKVSAAGEREAEKEPIAGEKRTEKESSTSDKEKQG